MLHYIKRTTTPNIVYDRASGAYSLNQYPDLPQRRDKLTVYDAITDYFGVLGYYSDEAVDEYMDAYGTTWQSCQCQNGSFHQETKHFKESFIYE